MMRFEEKGRGRNRARRHRVVSEVMQAKPEAVERLSSLSCSTAIKGADG
jgi:hypothetical protein